MSEFPNSIFKQLDEKLQIPIFNQSNHKFKHCPLFEGKKFDGIIKYLTDIEGGKNIHDCGKIAVTSDYTIDKNIIHSPKNVVSFNLHGCFFSNDDINASIVFDFKEKMKINIEHYSIKSICSGGEFGCHMKNWVVEVSDDGVNNWKVIHNVIDNDDLNKKLQEKEFMTDKNDLLTQFCRIRVTGKNSENIHYNIGIFQIEFFGYLYSF